MRDALILLNHESLGLISDLGVDPKQAAGNAAAEVGFAFPLARDLEFEDRVAAKARVAIWCSRMRRWNGTYPTAPWNWSCRTKA